MFEIVNGWTMDDDDEGRTPEQGYTISCYMYLQESKESDKKTTKKKLRHHFPHKSMGVYF